MSDRPGGLSRAFLADRRFLWALVYRMTGSAADADDLVQEAFARAIERPPANTDEPWRPWLVRVAMNLARDQLRRRRRTTYVGPWLPSPVDAETAVPSFEPGTAGEPAGSGAGPAGGGTEGRYDLLESVSMAFLLALEVLSPLRRAVLLLRDVFDYSVEETATALGLSEANVKTTHLRARRAMEAYDRERVHPRDAAEAAQRALVEFLTRLAANDVAGIEAMLAADVRAYSDGGGLVSAAIAPVVGAAKVTKFLLYVVHLQQQVNVRWGLRTLNGLPAVVGEFPDAHAPHARHQTLQVTLGPDGKIHRIYSVLAWPKLTALGPPPPAPPG